MIREFIALIRALIQQHRDNKCNSGEHDWKTQRMWSTRLRDKHDSSWLNRYDTLVHTCKNCGAEYKTIDYVGEEG